MCLHRPCTPSHLLGSTCQKLIRCSKRIVGVLQDYPTDPQLLLALGSASAHCICIPRRHCHKMGSSNAWEGCILKQHVLLWEHHKCHSRTSSVDRVLEQPVVGSFNMLECHVAQVWVSGEPTPAEPLVVFLDVPCQVLWKVTKWDTVVLFIERHFSPDEV